MLGLPKPLTLAKPVDSHVQCLGLQNLLLVCRAYFCPEPVSVFRTCFVKQSVPISLRVRLAFIAEAALHTEPIPVYRVSGVLVWDTSLQSLFTTCPVSRTCFLSSVSVSILCPCLQSVFLLQSLGLSMESEPCLYILQDLCLFAQTI